MRLGDRCCACGRTFLTLPGGVIGGVDDLIIVRGINIYPSALEAIVRACDVDEFRIVRFRRHEMEEVLVEVEAADGIARAVADEFHRRLGVRIDVQTVRPGSLPRFELKARRVVDRRDS